MSDISEKKLGLPSAVAACVGLIVATSCLMSLGTGMGLAGDWFILAMFAVVILNTFMAISFKELNWMMPHAEGGLAQYTKVGMGSVPAIISTSSAYVIVNLLALCVEFSLCGMMVNQILLPSVPSTVISVVLIVLLTIVNYLGVDIFSKVQNIVVALLLLSMLAMGTIACLGFGTGEIVDRAAQETPPAASFGGAMGLTALAFWLFIGIEFVIPLTKSVKNPQRNIGLAMVLGVLVIFIGQTILGHGMTKYVPYADLSDGDNLPHLLFAENLLGRPGAIWMTIVTMFASVSTANTLFGTIPGIVSGMAKNDMMPMFFTKKNRFGTPVVGLFAFSAIVLIEILAKFAESTGLVNILLAASCFWLTSYIFVSITVLNLRKRYPGHPGRSDRLKLLGLPQIICIIGDIFMIWNIAEGADRILIYKIFFIILAVLIVYAVVWTKFVKKIPMFKGASLDDVLYSEHMPH